jgi:uncharacterized Zn finger protein (UPF0148 family)
MTCATCGTPLVCFCPRCRGKAGGVRVTKKRRRIAAKTLAKNRAMRWPPKA